MGVERASVASETSGLSPRWDLIDSEQRRRLVQLAFLMTGSFEVAEDSVHEALVRCAPRLSGIERPEAYLRTAVVNECRTHFRHKERFARRDLPTMPSDFPDDVVETLDALEALRGRKRAVIVLRYFVDVPDHEIASILGCRPATVRSLARRALADLREALQ